MTMDGQGFPFCSEGLYVVDLRNFEKANGPDGAN